MVQQTAPAASGEAAPAARMRSMTEALPSALEPELRRIIDTAVARVAAIELDAIREARELTQRSEREAREALRFALDRAFNLINTLELLAATVGGMAEALRIELDDAIEALRNVPEPESELARELSHAAPAAEPAPPQPEQAAAQAPAPTPEPVAQKPTPEPQPIVEQPEPEPAVAETPVPEPEPVAETPAPAPAAAAPEPPRTEAPVAEATEATPPEAPEEVREESRADASSNGYPPAERHAQSLAAAAAAEAPSQSEEATAVEGGSPDGRPAVPARRRGLMRRLFSR